MAKFGKKSTFAATSGAMHARKEGGVGWMTYDQQAKFNAVTYDMRSAIPRIMQDFESDTEVRVVVITGAGDKAFIAGSDISQFSEKRSSEDARRMYDKVSEEANLSMRNFTKPMIAMIKGYCLGAGVITAMLCDFCSPLTMRSLEPPPLGLGFDYDSVDDLVKRVGPSYAAEMLFTGDRYGAMDALKMGLINRVVTSSELEPTVQDIASTIATNAPLTLRSIKTSIRNSQMDERARDMAMVNTQINACFDSEDYKEGRQSFLEKRVPVFKGK